MKQLLIISAAITFFASCNSDQKTNSETTKDVVGVSDSTTYKNNMIADTAHITPAPVAAPVTSTTETRVETSKATRTKITPKHTKHVVPPVNNTATVTPAPQSQSTTTTTTGTSTTAATGTPANVTPATPAAAPVKKGWSSAAKDATIGGVGGALGGALISKKKGTGAIIGGALGAAGGYILGRKKDKSQDTAR